MHNTLRAVITSVNVAFLFATATLAQAPPPKTTCRGPECAALSRAELFLAAFAAAGDAPGLRTSLLEQSEKTRNAFYGIDATLREVEAGRLTEAEGDFIIDGHKQVIRDMLHDAGNAALLIAATGQVSAIPGIYAPLGRLLSVARQDALLGREELAGDAMRRMVAVLVTFSDRFAETCEQQTFPAEVALALARQNALMGTSASLLHCAMRAYTADIDRQGVRYQLVTCSAGGFGPWTLKISGKVTGTGEADDAFWTSEASYQGRQYSPTGVVEVVDQAIVVKEERAVVPDDAGPLAVPNLLPKAPIPPRQRYPEVRVVKKLRMTTIELRGDHGFDGWTSNLDTWAEALIQTSDKPCKK